MPLCLTLALAPPWPRNTSQAFESAQPNQQAALVVATSAAVGHTQVPKTRRLPGRPFFRKACTR